MIMEYRNKPNEECDVSRLKNFSVSFLAICLGLIGFTLAWQKAEHILKLPIFISSYLLYFTLFSKSSISAYQELFGSRL